MDGVAPCFEWCERGDSSESGMKADRFDIEVEFRWEEWATCVLGT